MCMDDIRVKSTAEYRAWYKAADENTRYDVDARLYRVRQGNFGDHKSVGDGVFELRFKRGAGTRIYYTFDGKEMVLLLVGGNKRTQKQDIKMAKAMLQTIKEGKHEYWRTERMAD